MQKWSPISPLCVVVSVMAFAKVFLHTVGFSSTVCYCPCRCWSSQVPQVRKGPRGCVSSSSCYPHWWCVFPWSCGSGVDLDLGLPLVYSGFSLCFAAISVLARIPMATLDTGLCHPSFMHSRHLDNCRTARHADYKRVKICQTWVSI